MRWLILSRGLTPFLESLTGSIEAAGNEVTHRYLEGLLDRTVLDHDVILLKSRVLPFIYSGFLAQAHGKQVIPDPLMAYRVRNRWEAEMVMQEAGIRSPGAVMGYPKALLRALEDDFYPAVKKPLMGSKSRGVRIISSGPELEELPCEELVYLQRYVRGEHFQLDYLGDEIYMRPKSELGSDATGGPIKDVPPEIRDIIDKYRTFVGTPMGDMDVVIGDGIWVVDPGLFPGFEYLEDAGQTLGGLLMRMADR